MHELGIAQQVVELAVSRCEGERITRIDLEVGQLSAVLPDALLFCFDAASAGTRAEGAELRIIQVPGRARCRACGAELQLSRPFGRCACGETDLEWLSGDELRIKQMEVL
ncbi:MAG TPA: hydrogenase maturation nickel metallochaperone HypA [Myxococcales bacterium]|jgi:hydrogenase nickel incorporation protein HypA/HybF|nr:hydrogenase maturation nickel metallochaperone HypA [Myxococcales bacterium]